MNTAHTETEPVNKNEVEKKEKNGTNKTNDDLSIFKSLKSEERQLEWLRRATTT